MTKQSFNELRDRDMCGLAPTIGTSTKTKQTVNSNLGNGEDKVFPTQQFLVQEYNLSNEVTFCTGMSYYEGVYMIALWRCNMRCYY